MAVPGLTMPQIAKHKGYEVKTQGDSFMVTFHTVDAGVQCAMDVQVALLRQVWPDWLLRQDNGKEVVDQNCLRLFAGLRVRMGLHVGPTTVWPCACACGTSSRAAPRLNMGWTQWRHGSGRQRR